MGSYLSQTPGGAAGWVMFAFVAGVALHSALPFHRLSPSIWAAVFLIVSTLLILAASVNSVRGRFSLALLIPLLLFAFAFGIWRFDVSPRPKLLRIDGRLIVMRQAEDPHSVFGRWRRSLTRRIASHLPAREAALIAGILYGDANFSKDQRELFRDAGLLHIVAVSGSNVTIIVQYLSLLCLKVGFRRRRMFWILSGCLILFTAFVGFAASVARAAFMGWLLLFAREVGRLARPFRILLVAATLLLLIDPWQLAFDIGFALSFLAMWGLLAWMPLFETWLVRIPNWLELRRSLAMTAAAMLTTAPYVVWTFHRLPLAGLFINLLALPVIPLIMGWGTVAAIWGSLPGGAYASAAVFGLARGVESIAGLAQFVPWLNLKIEGMNFSTLVGIYLGLLYFWSKLKGKNHLSTFFRVKRSKNDILHQNIYGH